MEILENKVPFPQANDFEKIVKIIAIQDEAIILNDETLGTYLDGISSRQARYYIAAAKYLGILDTNKRFTDIGIKIRGLNEYLQKVELARLLLSDPVFGRVYITERVLCMTLDKSDIVDIIKEENPGYCEAIYYRRAQTVTSWLQWLKNILDSN